MELGSYTKKGISQFARFDVLTALLLVCDIVSTGKVTNVTEDLAALYSVYRRLGRLFLCVGKNSAIVISGFRREVDENCVFLDYCAAGGGNSVPTIRDNQLVPSSGIKKQRKKTIR